MFHVPSFLVRALTAAVLILVSSAGAAPAQTHGHGAHGAAAISITGAWARPTIARMRITAAYFQATVAEGGDTLVAAKTPVAARAELHEHVMENGIARMREVAGVPIAPGAPVVFQPGGFHVMIMDLTQPLHEGDTFPLTLTFAKAGDVTVDVKVMKTGGAMDHGAHKH